jgi:hypothetical protein
VCQGGLGLDFEVSGLLQVVGIGDKIGLFLRPGNGELQGKNA